MKLEDMEEFLMGMKSEKRHLKEQGLLKEQGRKQEKASDNDKGQAQGEGGDQEEAVKDGDVTKASKENDYRLDPDALLGAQLQDHCSLILPDHPRSIEWIRFKSSLPPPPQEVIEIDIEPRDDDPASSLTNDKSMTMATIPNGSGWTLRALISHLHSFILPRLPPPAPGLHHGPGHHVRYYYQGKKNEAVEGSPLEGGGFLSPDIEIRYEEWQPWLDATWERLIEVLSGREKGTGVEFSEDVWKCTFCKFKQGAKTQAVMEVKGEGEGEVTIKPIVCTWKP